MRISCDTAIKAGVIAVCGSAALLLSALVSEYYWALALLPFFILPLLRQIGWLSVLDERAMRHSTISSSIAFLVLLFFLIVLEVQRAFHPVQQGYLGLIVLAVLVKLFAYAAMNFRPRTSAIAIGFLCGGFWIWFGVASGWPDPVSMLMHSVFGLVISAATAVGLRWPYVGSVLLFLIALCLSVFPVMHIIDDANISLALFMLTLLSSPPALAGGFFIYDELHYKRGLEISDE